MPPSTHQRYRRLEKRDSSGGGYNNVSKVNVSGLIVGPVYLWPTRCVCSLHCLHTPPIFTSPPNTHYLSSVDQEP